MSHAASLRSLKIALGITFIVAVAELVGGIAFGSLALTADAAHMLSDSVALVVALAAQHLAARPATGRHSFGWRRAEVVGAQFNGLLLLGLSAWIVLEAIHRLGEPSDINTTGLFVVALIGLVANLYCTRLLHSTPGHGMNVRAAALHTLSDAAGSLGVLVAGLATLLWGWGSADAVASIFIAVLVAVAALRLVSESTLVLLEATPRSLDPDAIQAALNSHGPVTAVHHLHVWALTPNEVALSAHIEMEGPVTLHEAQEEAQALKALLAERFEIHHATLELECHPCAPSESVH